MPNVTRSADLPRLRFEHVRAWAAVGVALPVGFTLIAGGRALGVPVGSLAGAMLMWDVFCLAYAAFTLSVFRGTDGARMRTLVENHRVSTWARLLAGGTDGPGFSVQFAAVAVAGAALLPRVDLFAPSEDEVVVLSVLIVVAVAMSIVVVTLSYAVYYARLDAAARGLVFPGDTEPGFVDYLYFSAAVATTFGTTDIEVTSSRLRRAVTGHSVVTFVFNTVTIALLVAALT